MASHRAGTAPDSQDIRAQDWDVPQNFMKIQAKAKVQITVETDAECWGEDCSIGQLYKQASESGITNVRNALQSSMKVRIIGEPKVIGIITEQQP